MVLLREVEEEVPEVVIREEMEELLLQELVD